jgi:putrescine transport system substrate-binding protein
MPSRSFLAAAALAAAPALVHGAEVHVYNWADYIAPDTVAKFEAETGIRVVYDVYDSNEVLEAKLLAGNSGYDVVVPTSTFLLRQVNVEVYQPLDRTKLPHWDNLDAALMADAAADDPANAHSAVYLWGTNGIGYNVARSPSGSARMGRRTAGRWCSIRRSPPSSPTAA